MRSLEVLLVDDDQNDRAMFRMAVDKTDFNIQLHTLAAGQDAIDYLEAKGVYSNRSAYPLPDVVVLDLKMPQVNGFDFLAWRKPSRAMSSIPVVVLSGSTDQDEIEKALEMGADKHILKPSGFEAWKNVVQEIWTLGIEGTAVSESVKPASPHANPVRTKA